ncbi:sugar-transfer associated ATP-grasp domain-containing protein [Tabrizicola sp.]|uniref:sugar-transfer associated ATP-grasp domain-containing protein n=1 Tax=Tabrizicola sp. TaxID=2005166 RepID=UPI002FDCFAD7
MTDILTHKPKTRRFNFRTATEFASKQRGVSAGRIGLETMLLSLGSRRLSAEDYFLHGAWRPGLTWAERRSFIGSRPNLALNTALNPSWTPEARERTRDKLHADALFRASGLPVAETRAVAATADPGRGYRWLPDPRAVLAYLREPGALPCFGKPVHGSVGVGAVRLEAWEDEDNLRLGDGRRVAAADLVTELWAKHAEGYIFAEIVHPHPGLARLIGPVIGTLRVVTADAGRGPEPLYAVLKTPAPGATVDSLAGPLGGYAAVDLVSGRILREQDRRRMGGVDRETNIVTGIALAGETLPDFAGALATARAAHACLDGHGILGIDILLSDRGPLVNEANSNPHHSTYQIAMARGVLNPDILPRLQEVRARFRSVTPRPKYCPLK